MSTHKYTPVFVQAIRLISLYYPPMCFTWGYLERLHKEKLNST